MKNRIYAPLALLVLVAILAACGGARTPAAQVTATQAAATDTPPTEAPSATAPAAAAATAVAEAAPTQPPLSPTATAPPRATATPIDEPEPARPGYFSREALLADARQLAAIIEDTHPDPYIRGGGKIAFQIRLDKLLHAIPDEGLTKDGFIQLLRPFLAAIGDSHTEIWTDYGVSYTTPGGIPVHFGIVEQELYVAGVLDPAHEYLIGAVLTAVEGIPVAKLVARQRELVPLENDYHVLEEMASRTLYYAPYLQDALPEWQDAGQIAATFRLPGGEAEEITFALPVRATRTTWPGTAVDLPAPPETGFSYNMLTPPGADEEIAYLRVDHMEGFREAAETMGKQGSRLPSATEMFRDLALEMKEAGTQTLVVDLRANGGGSSLMGDILIYTLYGKEALTAIQYAVLQAGGQVNRYSAQCFTPPNNVGATLEELNEGRSVPVELGGYDFREFFYGDADEFEAYVAAMDEPPFLGWFKATPTFWAEYESEAHSGTYLPENVLVLISPWTFSSGFTMARDLYRAGATLVGTPSAQASNTFGNGLLWELDNTGLQGQVTRSYFVIVPEDSGLATVLPVQVPLTYDKLASYHFDPNAAFLLALEVAAGEGE
jgi:hypothetical protein